MTSVTQETGNRHTARHHRRESPALGSARQNRYTDRLHTASADRSHQFASEALDASPREIANISQVLGHDSIETTLHFYIHPSANAEQRIGAMMNARWTGNPTRPPA
jgi:hypothetical protein